MLGGSRPQVGSWPPVGRCFLRESEISYKTYSKAGWSQRRDPKNKESLSLNAWLEATPTSTPAADGASGVQEPAEAEPPAEAKSPA
jgi:hypothetical protein